MTREKAVFFYVSELYDRKPSKVKSPYEPSASLGWTLSPVSMSQLLVNFADFSPRVSINASFFSSHQELLLGFRILTNSRLIHQRAAMLTFISVKSTLFTALH